MADTRKCKTPICLVCAMGPCPYRIAEDPVTKMLAALESIERISRSKGMTLRDMKAAMRDIEQAARAAAAIGGGK